MTNQLTLLQKLIDHVVCLCGKLSQDVEVSDCDGNTTTEQALPVAIKGVVLTKPCEKPVDYEYITTPALCIDDTWQYQLITKEDGVTTSTENIDTGISCDEPMPVDIEVIQKERCDTVTGTIWKQPVYYTPSDVEDATTTTEVAVGVEYDTGISCESLLTDVDVTDCDGVVTTERAVPVAIKGTSSVKECNSDALLAEAEAQTQLLTDLLSETEDQSTQLDTIISSIASAITELQAINANTDTLEQGLADILADMQNLDRVDDLDYSALLNEIIDEIQAIDFDTSAIEALLTTANNQLVTLTSEVDQVEELLTEIRDKLYITNRTPFCTTDDPRLPKYLVDWSDGTKTIEDPIDGESNWCECDC